MLASSREQEHAPLSSEEDYEQGAGAEATVWSCIMVIESGEWWDFPCLQGQDGRALRWISFEEGGLSNPTSQVDSSSRIHEKIGSGRQLNSALCT